MGNDQHMNAQDRPDVEGDMLELNITPEMIRAGAEQSRVDSSLTMTAERRVARITRAVLTGNVDHDALHATLSGPYEQTR